MKKWKKLSALLLVFLMTAAFAACGQSQKKEDTPKQEAVGTWSLKIDLSTAMKEELGSEFADLDAPFIFTVYLDLNDDGSYKMYVDETETEKDMETFIDALADYFTEYLYTVAEAQGLDRTTAQAALVEQFGMPVKEYAFQELKNSMNISELTDSIVQEGVYEIKKDKFYMGSEKIDSAAYDLITIEGDKLTLSIAKDASASPFFDEAIPGLSYPFELTRVKQ